jgi:mRNA guanylyltransferase
VIDKSPNSQIKIKYLVFDCLVLDGNSLMERPLDKRIGHFESRFIEPYKQLYAKYPEEVQFLPFLVEQKKMEVSYGTEMMFKSVLPNLPHGNDGLIFTCVKTPYKPGTDQHILKWKPENENSIDFRLDLQFPFLKPDEQDISEGVNQPYVDYDAIPVANLMVNHGSGHEEWYGEMYLDEELWEQLKAENKELDDRVVECYMDDQKRWRFMRWRDDKKDANHISTVNSVIESITDRVTERDLILAAKSIRDAWKKRQAEEHEARSRAAGAQKRKASDQ